MGLKEGNPAHPAERLNDRLAGPDPTGLKGRMAGDLVEQPDVIARPGAEDETKVTGRSQLDRRAL